MSGVTNFNRHSPLSDDIWDLSERKNKKLDSKRMVHYLWRIEIKNLGNNSVRFVMDS